MSGQPPSLPPAGWYPDPAESGRSRYWTGAGWGEQAPTNANPVATVTADPVATRSAERPTVLQASYQPPQTLPRNSAATAALVLGICSFLVNLLLIPSILGIIFGIVGLRRSSVLGGRNKALVGLILSIIGGIVSTVLFVSLIAGNSNSFSQGVAAGEPSAAAGSAAPAASKPKAAAPAKVASKPKPKAAAPAVPVEYQSAMTKAQEYSDTMHMSKKGIYDQLTSSYGEQFSKAAGQYAVNHVNADWNANALAKAKDYQTNMSMSPAAIHDQLTSTYGEKFTQSQADYAIAHLND